MYFLDAHKREAGRQKRPARASYADWFIAIHDKHNFVDNFLLQEGFCQVASARQEQ
jgi:hypothetical protein